MSSHASIEPLGKPDGQPSAAFRQGNTVRRPAEPSTPTVHALLHHLESAGFPASPRVVGDGYDVHGNEVLGYVEGQVQQPRPWSDEGIWRLGRLLRALHDATASFRPPSDARWKPWFFHSTSPEAIISHGDLGPWNILERDGIPVAFLDWEFAGPFDRRDELAATGWWNVQLHDDDVAELNGLHDARTRAAALCRFLDGYELPGAERVGLITRMIEYAIRDCAKEAVWPVTSGGEPTSITPESTDPLPLWALAWRARSATWLLDHRAMLERAIGA